jgi:hypothetical protein
MDIVYRMGAEGPGTVVFAERWRAEYVAHVWKAIEEYSSWGASAQPSSRRVGIGGEAND